MLLLANVEDGLVMERVPKDGAADHNGSKVRSNKPKDYDLEKYMTAEAIDTFNSQLHQHYTTPYPYEDGSVAEPVEDLRDAWFAAVEDLQNTAKLVRYVVGYFNENNRGDGVHRWTPAEELPTLPGLIEDLFEQPLQDARDREEEEAADRAGAEVEEDEEAEGEQEEGYADRKGGEEGDGERREDEKKEGSSETKKNEAYQVEERYT